MKNILLSQNNEVTSVSAQCDISLLYVAAVDRFAKSCIYASLFSSFNSLTKSLRYYLLDNQYKTYGRKL